MQLAPIDLVVIGVYAVGIFGLAQYVSRAGKDIKAHGGRNATDYFLASRSLPWWAIGSSLIAANISAEQIIGMSGSGYAYGLAVSAYEWMAALTLLIVGKWFLPIFLGNQISTMPQFLEQRYGPRIRSVMAVFWLALYVLVNLTSILWLGATAMNAIEPSISLTTAITIIGIFALAYQISGGLKAVAMTDIVQVTLLVIGGALITYITLNKVGGDQGAVAGFGVLQQQAADHFHMILSHNNKYFTDMPGFWVLFNGMWAMNLSYWGCNQYIIQRALAAKSIDEARKGIVFAGFLKLITPFIIVIPGIAAVVLAPHLDKSDQAYPTMMRLLPAGVRGLVFAALIAAIISSLASKINSIATIFTMDVYAKMAKNTEEHHLVTVGRITAVVAVAFGVIFTKPLLGSLDQAFNYIQEYTGFFTPGICVIFLLGLFWKKATEAGALVAAVGSFVLSLVFKFAMPDVPFLNRVGIVFLLCMAAAIGVSLVKPAPTGTSKITIDKAGFHTKIGFNIGAVIVVAAVVVFYAKWW